MYNVNGERKYLTKTEVTAFLAAAKAMDPATHSFCWFIAVTGCRISEALSLSAKNVDFETKHAVIRSLKKRSKRVYRAIPLPANLLAQIRSQLNAGILDEERLWPWSRMTGYRRICAAMQAADVRGGHASPKGLRHGFGVRAIQANVPLTLVQRWLGHADIKTTAIYTSAVGPEERDIASRTWSGLSVGGPRTANARKPRVRLKESAIAISVPL
ncbi:tyrosine-type recombinase/integrase [Sphingomonas sp. CJ20]